MKNISILLNSLEHILRYKTKILAISSTLVHIYNKSRYQMEGYSESNNLDIPSYLTFEIPFGKFLLNFMKNTKWERF